MATGGDFRDFAPSSTNSSNQMSKPLPLVESKQKTFQLNPAAFEVLSQIDGPLTVVGIVGRYRDGKSYLANWFMTQQFGSTGFALGSTLQSKTKGIWFWCCPNPFHDGTLIVLDTEGLEDPEKGDPTHDLNIFIFTVLMSSYFILNSVGKIDDHSIQILHFVIEMVDRIRVKADQVSSAEELSSIFPTFGWVLRDFFLEERVNGRDVTPKEYMEHCLKLKESGSGSERYVNEYNFPRKTIKKYFNKRNCFCLPRPAVEEQQLRNLDSLQAHELRPVFVTAADDLYCHVLYDARPYVMNGTTLTGTMWLKVLESYVKAVNEGAVPVISNAFESMAQSENQRAIKESLEVYKKQMESKGKKVRELEDIMKDHTEAEKKALYHFRKLVIGDYGGDAHQKMEEELFKAYESFRGENFTRSENDCRRLLSNLYQPITNKVQNGSYLVLGGYEKYEKDRTGVEQKYKNQANGPAKETVFTKEFHQDRLNEAKLIMNADKKLTDAERENLKEKRKHEQLLAEQKRTELENKRQKEMIQQLKESHSEQMKAFKKNMTEETEKIRKKNEENLEELRNQFKNEKDNMLESEKREWERKEKYYMDRISQNDALKDRIAELEDKVSDMEAPTIGKGFKTIGKAIKQRFKK